MATFYPNTCKLGKGEPSVLLYLLNVMFCKELTVAWEGGILGGIHQDTGLMNES